MLEPWYSALSVVFGPVLGMPLIVAEIIIATVITFITTCFSKLLVNQSEVRNIKMQLKDLQKQANELQKTDPEAAKAKVNEVLKLTNKQMKLNMRPMLPTLVFVLLFFPWMAKVFTGQIALLPFSLPYFGSDFGWLMWYIIISLPMSVLLRKAMGVE